MNFVEYQNQIIYPALGISGETGEVAELVKKWIRDEQSHNMSDIRKEKIMMELGDILWYIANLCSDLDVSLDTVAQWNVNKLADRHDRGVIQGDGDER